MAVWLSGCSITQYDDYPAAIASAFHAKDVRVTVSKLADSRIGSKKTFIATLIEDPDAGSLWVPKSKVASGCAKFIFERMSPEQRKDFNQIQIKVLGEENEDQFNYNVHDLAQIDAYLNVVSDYLERVCNRNYEELEQFVDPLFVTVADQQSFLQTYARIDSLYGGQELPTIGGFEVDTINYSGKLSVVRVWASTISNEVIHAYRFLLSNNDQPPLILAVGLNDE